MVETGHGGILLTVFGTRATAIKKLTVQVAQVSHYKCPRARHTDGQPWPPTLNLTTLFPYCYLVWTHKPRWVPPYVPELSKRYRSLRFVRATAKLPEMGQETMAMSSPRGISKTKPVEAWTLVNLCLALHS